LSALALEEKVSASTQNQALAALLFFYDKVLGSKLPEIELTRAKRPARLPTVMSPQQVQALLSKLDGTPKLMASLLYGSGLRLQECVSLRVKDVDFATHQLCGSVTLPGALCKSTLASHR
jgi:site-specific recombinase XerD